MAFEAKDYAISDILNKSVFDIPRNQRRYVWKKEHWRDLYEDARMLEDSYSDELLQEFADNLKRKIPSYEWLLNAFKNVGWSNHYIFIRVKEIKLGYRPSLKLSRNLYRNLGRSRNSRWSMYCQILKEL